MLLSDTPFDGRALDELLNDSTISHSFHTGLSDTSLRIPFNGTNARYVRVQLQNKGILSLAEVEVFGSVATDSIPNVPVSNVALGKSAQQSTTSHNGLASRAVDGNTDGNWRAGSTTHTTDAEQSWWQVDLAAQSSIRDIVVHNRVNCCTDRLSNFYVLLSDTPFDGRTLEDLLNDSTISRSFHTGLTDTSLRIPVTGTNARYVRVQLQNQGILSLAEVEVFGSVQ